MWHSRCLSSILNLEAQDLFGVQCRNVLDRFIRPTQSHCVWWLRCGLFGSSSSLWTALFSAVLLLCFNQVKRMPMQRYESRSCLNWTFNNGHILNHQRSVSCKHNNHNSDSRRRAVSPFFSFHLIYVRLLYSSRTPLFFFHLSSNRSIFRTILGAVWILVCCVFCLIYLSTSNKKEYIYSDHDWDFNGIIVLSISFIVHAALRPSNNFTPVSQFK